MAPADQMTTTVQAVAAAETWNKRVSLIRAIPEHFGTAQQEAVYKAIAEEVYISSLAPDFAYIHWRDDYELEGVVAAYTAAHEKTEGFSKVDEASLAAAIESAPSSLRIFRLLTGLTTQEFAAATEFVVDETGGSAVQNGMVKSIEAGRKPKASTSAVLGAVVDRAMRGVLFPMKSGEVRSKIDKPDTIAGWETVRKYATENVPLPVSLHQRHYGGAFRQLLDATSTRRGNTLEDAVEELFMATGIRYIRTGPSNQNMIAHEFGLTVKPAPDFVIYDASKSVKALLECKHANDGGTARDKASRFRGLRAEGVRLGGVPVFAVLAGLGWRRAADTIGPVIRDCDGRVFSVATLDQLMTVDPFVDLASKVSPPKHSGNQ